MIAHEEVMGWIEQVVGEMADFKKFFDPITTKVAIDLSVLRITTTLSTTRLNPVSQKLML